MDQIDTEGFRSNVGIILCNKSDQVLVGGRVGKDSWQFPQGGIQVNESPEQAMYRELLEEIGLSPEDVAVLGMTSEWLHYRLPERFVRRKKLPLCIGQKQLWFLLRFLAPDNRLRLDGTKTPEFDRWAWVDYWHPMYNVIFFKRAVYRQALQELRPLVFSSRIPAPDG